MSWENLPGSLLESDITLLGQGTRIEGAVVFDRFTRVHGRIEGKVHGLPGSTVVIGETASVHGDIEGAEVIVDGFVHGNIRASEKVTVSQTGKVIGDIACPKLELLFGAFFEGRAATSGNPDRPRASRAPDTNQPSV